MNKSQWGRALGFLWALLAGILISSQPGRAATTWHAWVGAQSKDLGRQALAFLPNEIWIHQNDSIMWQFAVDEPHTITFLSAGQPRPSFMDGCPGFATQPTATFNGSTCLSAPPSFEPSTFTVQFTAAGNFRVVCLFHPDMTGLIHVLNTGAPLPHDQGYYDAQAASQGEHLLDEADHDGHPGQGGPLHDAHVITAGDGEVLANAGGKSTAALLRYTDSTLTIHAGETVEWENRDPSTPHTITFGPADPPGDPSLPSANVTTDADGARHVTLNAPSDTAHSGFILALPQDQPGQATPPLQFFVTRFRVTFKTAGTYPFFCVLHDDLGMKGQITVK